MNILTLNSGSSSLKVALYACGINKELLLSGGCHNIGSDRVFCQLSDSSGHVINESRVPIANHAAAAAMILEWLGDTPVTAVGHRIVHGGPHFVAPTRIDARVIEELEAIIDYDPLHLPSALAVVAAAQERYPTLPHVACFDTAFHRELPPVARTYPLPRQLMGDALQKYGFHGLSYASAVKTLGSAASDHRLIVAHLGSGASVAAIRAGKSIDTSMGFSSAGGVMMATRSGDLDPGLIAYLVETHQLDGAALRHLFNTESGLQAVGGSCDMEQLLEREASSSDAALAISLFCYQVIKMIGAYSAVLNGLDTLAFTGGIGEKSAAIRGRICAHFDYLGIAIDNDANAAHSARISTPNSRIDVRVVPANEESIIAGETLTLVAPALTKE